MSLNLWMDDCKSPKLQYGAPGWINTTSSFKQQFNIQEKSRLYSKGEKNYVQF